MSEKKTVCYYLYKHIILLYDTGMDTISRTSNTQISKRIVYNIMIFYQIQLLEYILYCSVNTNFGVRVIILSVSKTTIFSFGFLLACLHC